MLSRRNLFQCAIEMLEMPKAQLDQWLLRAIGCRNISFLQWQHWQWSQEVDIVSNLFPTSWRIWSSRFQWQHQLDQGMIVWELELPIEERNLRSPACSCCKCFCVFSHPLSLENLFYQNVLLIRNVEKSQYKKLWIISWVVQENKVYLSLMHSLRSLTLWW